MPSKDDMMPTAAAANVVTPRATIDREIIAGVVETRGRTMVVNVARTTRMMCMTQCTCARAHSFITMPDVIPTKTNSE